MSDKKCTFCDGVLHVYINAASQTSSQHFPCPVCRTDTFCKQLGILYHDSLRPQWLPRTITSECNPPFALYDTDRKEIKVFGIMHFQGSKVHPSFTHYLPLPPLPPKPQEDDSEFEKWWADNYEIRRAYPNAKNCFLKLWSEKQTK